MKKIFASLFLVIFLSTAAVFSQTPKPTPTAAPAPRTVESPDDDDVVKISTTLIQIDVSVTDKKGGIAAGLKPEDFEIYENGKKQEITNFSFVSSAREVNLPATAAAASDKTAIPRPPTQSRPDQIRRTVALVVDDLSLSFESVYQVRRALKKFVDEQMQTGDLVAIIRTGAGIGALQQFTSDKRMLYAAIEKVRWNPLGNGKIGAFAPIEPTPLEQLQAAGGEVSDEDLQREKNQIQSFNDFQGSVFATGTLGALRYIVGGMGELPGRKAVILFSDGFKLTQKDEQGFTETGRVLEFLRQLVDLANRASVVFYTLDARGLQTTGFTAQDKIVDASPQNILSKLSERSAELFDTQEGLVYLARETGGIPVINNNDLSGGVRRILEDQSYYLIGYQPDDETFDPKTRRYNKLEVRVKREGLNVRYRSGFFGVSDEKSAVAQSSNVAALTPYQRINNALTSPFAVNDISLRLNALFGNDARQGSYVRSLLHVNARDLKFTDEPDGGKKAVFDVLAMSFGDNGVPVDKISKSYTLTVKNDYYQKILNDGFVYYFVFPTKPGAYQMRIAIRDAQAEKVGSASQFVEVPNLKKEQLTVSGIVLENLTAAQWEKLSNQNAESRPATDQSSAAAAAASLTTDPLTHTSLRRFKRGTILRYGFEVYNAKLDAAKKPNLTTRIRIFREDKLILDGKPSALDLFGQTDLQRIKSVGAVSLTDRMQPGDYVLQIIVTDNLAKEKNRVTTQFVQFEVIG